MCVCISQSFSHIPHCHFSRNILNKRKRKRSFLILSACETNNNSRASLFCEKQIIRAPTKGFPLYACNLVFIFRYRKNLLVRRVHYSVEYYIYCVSHISQLYLHSMCAEAFNQSARLFELHSR